MGTSLKVVLASFAAAVMAVGCSSSKSSDSGGGSSTNSTLTISGKLGTSSSLMAHSLDGKVNAMSDVGMQAVSLSDLEIYAIAFTNPPAIGQANVNSDGSFTVDLAGAKGSSVTAVFRDKTNSNEVGTVTFRDTSKKDMNGNSYKDSSSIVLSDNVSLGNITLGDDGKVVVDVSTISTVVAAPAASSAAFDMSGVWKANAFSNPPTGYKTTCAAGTPNNECEGLPENAEIALIRIAGKDFTPNAGQCDRDAASVTCDATANGTVGTTDRYALSVWEASGVTACGHKLGFSEAEARAGGLIHVDPASLPTIAGTQMQFGDMTSYNPYFWIKNAATATRPYMDCRGVSVTVGTKEVKGYACKGDTYNDNNVNQNTAGWMVNLGNGGCVGSDGKPIMVNNWGSLTGSCGSPSTSGLPTGFSSNSCDYSGDPDGSGPLASQSFTCSWTGGSFTDSSGNPNLSSPVSGNLHVQMGSPAIAQGASCGDQADGSESGLTLQEAQCYAQYYEMNRNSFSTTCAPRPRFNWGANTLGDFYKVDFRQKPDAMFILDIMTYDATGELATVDTEERESFTVPSGSSSTVTCEIARKIVFNVKKTGANTAVVDIRFSGRMTSLASACQGLAKQAIENAAYNKTVAENLRRRAVDNADLEYILVPSAMIFNMTRQ